jgi:hypothetical protein
VLDQLVDFVKILEDFAGDLIEAEPAFGIQPR